MAITEAVAPPEEAETAEGPYADERWHPVNMGLTCRRCHRPVRTSAERYEVFDKMHYVCFHYDFEHGDVDVDDECQAGGCPSASLAGGRTQVIETARVLAGEAASGAPWQNPEMSQYLEAFAGWLADSDGFYLNSGRVNPGNGWEIVKDALRAATTYE